MSAEFLTFFIVLFAGLIFSGAFNRLHLPWVAALIIAGVIIGPYGLEVFIPNSTFEFIAEIGLVFLMFMAGLETRFSSLQENKREVSIFSFISASIPFLVGFGIGIFFDYSIVTSLLIGIVFISSSIAVVLPALEANNMLEQRIGRITISTAMVIDIASLVFLSILLQNIAPVTTVPLPLFYVLLLTALFALRKVIPRVHVFLEKLSKKQDFFEREIRLLFTIMLGTVIIFQLLGLHAIIAGFFAGFVLSDSVKNPVVKEKLHALSYGIFIPVFFVLVGTNMNLTVFTETVAAFLLVFVILVGSMLSKLFSGMLAGKILNMGKQQSLFMGLATMPQLSTTLAAVFVAFDLGLLDDQLVTAMIVLSIVTTLVTPFGIYRTAKKLSEQHEVAWK